LPYSGSTSNTDRLRLLVGDTSTSSAGELLSTGEATFFISQFGSVRAAAPHAANAIAAYFATKAADKSVGDLSIAYSRRAAEYRETAKRLERLSVVTAIPYAGGISRSDKDALEEDTDRVEPAFSIGMHDVVAPYSTRNVYP